VGAYPIHNRFTDLKIKPIILGEQQINKHDVEAMFTPATKFVTFLTISLILEKRTIVSGIHLTITDIITLLRTCSYEYLLPVLPIGVLSCAFTRSPAVYATCLTDFCLTTLCETLF